MSSLTKSPVLLTVYVGTHCFGCDIARSLARELESERIPGVVIRVIDLTDPAVARPQSVFAVPTYLLNDRVISLGNPEPDWLRACLTDLSNARGQEVQWTPSTTL